jgi:hypothetical protein
VRGYGESVSYHTVGKFLILNQWVWNQLDRSTGRVDSSNDSLSYKEARAIKMRDDFPHKCAQFEVDSFIGDLHVQCTVIESENIDFAQYFNLQWEFVKEIKRNNS